MRAGKLNTRISLYRLSLATLATTVIATTWASLRGKVDGTAPAPDSLRHPTLVEIRLRARDDLVAGDYAIWGSRLFHLFDVRDPDGKGAELIASAHELTGQTAVYTPTSGAPLTTRAYINHDSPYLVQHGQRIDYRTRIDLPIFEVGRPGPGGIVTVGSISYTLLGLADEGDDGVIRRYWGHT